MSSRRSLVRRLRLGPVLASAVVALSFGVGAGPATAQAPEAAPDVRTDAERYRARGIERTTLSPFCPGRTLYDCPSPRAAAWREDIRAWVAEGLSEAEIRARLEARAPGEQLRSEGPAAAAVIALVVLSLAGFVWWGVRERRRGRDAPDAAPRDETTTDRALDERLDDRLEQELDGLEHDLA